MITRTELLAYLDETLEPGRFQDYCPNGLQVAGKQEISTVISGVTASEAFLQAAIEADADAVLVHHGYFWRGEDQRVTGMKQRRLKLLLENDISLIAYHLPLDAHPLLGNNAQRYWGWKGPAECQEPASRRSVFAVVCRRHGRCLTLLTTLSLNSTANRWW